jgi:hypothetical protein
MVALTRKLHLLLAGERARTADPNFAGPSPEPEPLGRNPALDSYYPDAGTHNTLQNPQTHPQTKRGRYRQ